MNKVLHLISWERVTRRCLGWGKIYGMVIQWIYYNVQRRQAADLILGPEFCVRLVLGKKSAVVRVRERSQLW